MELLFTHFNSLSFFLYCNLNSKAQLQTIVLTSGFQTEFIQAIFLYMFVLSMVKLWLVIYLYTRNHFYFRTMWQQDFKLYLLLLQLKSAIQTDLKLTTTQLGWFDVSLLLPYAVAQILLGSLGDQVGSRRVLSLCLVTSGLSMVSGRKIWFGSCWMVK